MKTISLTLFLAFLVLYKPVLSQEPDTLSRPKIGLALSGGAAKGLAHIGVLLALEQLGITPDYITGTSMGAVVGSLYALGYTAKEISEMNTQADWEFLLSDRIPLSEVVFEEKNEYKRYLVGIPIRNYEFKLPSGMIEGQQLEKFYADAMWPLPKLESFDSLPIPFHCMSVDLLSGKAIEFRSGNLDETIRASMSIPSLFAPQNIDTMLLVDGGMMRNFPVQEVIDMGADIVIGVYTGFNEDVTKEDLFSLADVLSRTTVFLGIFDSKDQMELTSILLEPNMDGLGAQSFDKAKEIEVRGEIAALEIQQQLRDLIDSLGLKYTPVKKFDQPDKIYIKEIDVVSDRTFVKKNFIIGRSGLQQGSYVTKEQVSEAIDKIYGTQYFKKVTYNIETIQSDTFRLIFKVKESTRAFLNFAPRYDNQYGIGLITNLTLRNWLAPSSRGTLTLNIAENPGVRIDINKYLGKNQRIMSNYFVNWTQDERLLYNDGFDIGSYKLRNLDAGLGFKYSMSINHQLGIVGMYEIRKIVPQDNLNYFFQTPSFNNYSYRGLATQAQYHINTTDDKYFPKSGVRFDLCYQYNFKPKVDFDINSMDKAILDDFVYFNESEREFYLARLNFDLYTKLSDKIIFNLGTSAGITSDNYILTNFLIGGYYLDQRLEYIPFAGMSSGEAIMPNYGLIRTGFDIELIPHIYLTFQGNIGFSTESNDEIINFIKNSPLKAYKSGYCIGIRANTIIGPIHLMMGDNDYDGNVRWYFNIGYPF